MQTRLAAAQITASYLTHSGNPIHWQIFRFFWYTVTYGAMLTQQSVCWITLNDQRKQSRSVISERGTYDWDRRGTNSVKVLTFRKTFWALFQIAGSRLCERHIMSFLSRLYPFIDLPTFPAISKGYTAMTIPPLPLNKEQKNMYSKTSPSSTDDKFAIKV